MYTSKELELDLKEIDPRFSVVPNDNRPGLANIFLDGKNYDLHAVPTGEIKEIVDHEYRYNFPDGRSARHWTKEEVLDQAKGFLEKFNSGDMNGLYE
jgi:hypothetical protein